MALEIKELRPQYLLTTPPITKETLRQREGHGRGRTL